MKFQLKNSRFFARINPMSDLIEALQIFLKYGNPQYPTICAHDELRVLIDPKLVTPEDQEKLKQLGFSAYPRDELFMSCRFGSG